MIASDHVSAATCRAFCRRAVKSTRQHGIVGTARRIAARAITRRAELKWYRLNLASEHPRRRLEAGLTLRRGTAGDVDLVTQLPQSPHVTPMSPDVIEARLRTGAELYLVTEGDVLAFACWIFYGKAPVFGVKGGGVALPRDVALLEDSVASPEFRGRSIAPGAWACIADILQERGFSAIVTKVDVKNAASCRAVEKVGFHEIARMKVKQRFGRYHFAVRMIDDRLSNRWLIGLDRT